MKFIPVHFSFRSSNASFPRCILGSSHHSRVAEISTSAVIGLNKTSEYNADFNPMGVLEGILT
jgi:hypothetical protein